MGQYHPDHGWIPDRTEGRAARLKIAKSRMKAAHRPDRPIEAAVRDDPNPQRKAATQLMQLVGKHDREDFDIRDVMAALEHERHRLGHDDESSVSTSAVNAELIDELAQDVDDRTEEINSRGSEPEDDDDYDDDQDDDDEDAARADWLESVYGLTPHELAETLQGLDPEHRQAAVDAFEQLYALHLRGYGREAAEQIYLAQLNGGDSAEDAAAESYADAGGE